MLELMFAAIIMDGTPVMNRSVPSGDVQIVTVVDLDLSVEAGRLALDRRFKRAAMGVCGVKIVGDKVRNADIDQCRAGALARARIDAARMIAARDDRTRLAVSSR